METIIEVKNLVKNYGDKQILKNISFNINKGEIISIIGESGAGKSTLMRCLNGLEGVNAGSIKSTLGARERAIATLCFSPPDRYLALV